MKKRYISDAKARNTRLTTTIHMAEETDRRAMFTGPDGEFFQGIRQWQTSNG